MTIRPFDPATDHDRQILELQNRSEGDQDRLVTVPAEVSFEVAAQTPWYYVVDDEGMVLEGQKGGKGSGHRGHSGRPGKRGGSAPGTSLPSGHTERAQSNRLGLSDNEVGFAEVPPSSFVNVRSEYLPEKYHPFVTPYSAKEYKEMGAKLYISESGKSGYALKPDGDIISVFSSPSVKEGRYAIASAIANGGSKLDCFDGFLAQNFYPQFGFEEYDRWTWDDQYAPENWNYDEFGRPDVVFMKLPS